MNNNPERTPLNPNLHRRSTNKFPIRIHIERLFGFHSHSVDLKVLDLFDAEMLPCIYRGKQAEQLERIDAAHNANIEQPITHFCFGRDLHASAVKRSVRKRGQQRWLIAAHPPRSRRRLLLPRRHDFHPNRIEGENCRRQAEHISATPAQPAWQSICFARDFAVETNPGNTAKISRAMRRHHLTRVFAERNHPQINLAHVATGAAKSPPSLSRSAHASQPQRGSKIISASRRNDQYRQPQPHQLSQMPMHRPIPAEQHDHICVVVRSRHPHPPLNLRGPVRVRLKGLQIPWRTSQPENGRRAHLRRQPTRVEPPASPSGASLAR